MTATIASSSFGKEKEFSRIHGLDSSRLSRANNILCTSSTILPFVYCYSPLLLGTDRRKLTVHINCPIENEIPPAFEILQFLQFLGLAIPALQKLATEFFLFGLIKLVRGYFLYLSESMKEIGREIPQISQRQVSKKNISWIKIHQGAIRASHQIQDIFSPVVAFFYLSMIGVVACGISYQIHAERADFIQSQVLGGYMAITVFQFYLLCYMADQLCEEAARISDEAYSTPWFALDAENKGFINLIISMGNKPMRMMAYQAPSFVLSKEAFVSFMGSLISAYLGFSKMKELE